MPAATWSQWGPVLLIVFLMGVCSLALVWSDRRAPRLSHPLRALRNLFLPTALVYLVVHGLTHDPDARYLKVLLTFIWIELLWVVLTLIKALLFEEQSERSWRSRVPGLFVDITRMALVVIGGTLVIAEVWGHDVRAIATTLGVGSIVLGLALQETLGNLVAGLALLFEQPVSVGDWIQCGEVEGAITEINWRAIRVRTRESDEVTIPNSVIARERIRNFSRPTPLHAVRLFIGLSRDDPPNAAKRCLVQSALETSGICADPSPEVRLLSFGDSAIEYEVYVHITDYARLPHISNEFMTRAWYALRRERLSIPYPVQTILKTEMPQPSPPRDEHAEAVESLRRIQLFTPLLPEEAERLAGRIRSVTFAEGERIVEQGAPGDWLFVIRNGEAKVVLVNEHGLEHEVATLRAGDLFGEMALLTGEPRSATVVAQTDVDVWVVAKESLADLLSARPEIADAIARIVSTRYQSLAEVRSSERFTRGPGSEQEEQPDVLQQMRRFFGM